MKTTSTPGLRRTYVNLNKADWDRYRQEVETALSKRSQRDEKIFRTVLLKAASYHMPTGRFRIQNPFLTAQSTQIKSVISVPIKDFIHHYPMSLFNDIPRVGAHFYDLPGSGRSLTTYWTTQTPRGTCTSRCWML